MSELPNSWEIVPFLTVADLLRGVTYSKADARSEAFNGSIPVLRANNIQNRQFQLVDLVHVPKKLVADKQLICRGDVVVATSSGSISVVGKAAQAMEDMTAGFGAFCGLLRPKSGINPRYFGFFFSSDDYRKTVSALARGVNINNLKREHFETLAIPLAPLAEQKRIADKLEALLGRVDACRARLDRVPALLKRFRQSVLAAATSGKLTEEWREVSGATFPYVQFPLSKICSRITDGEHISPKRVSSGIPLLTAKNVKDHGVEFDDTHFVTPADAVVFWKRCQPLAGDVLICSRGTIGRCAEVPKEATPFCLMGTVILLKPDRDQVVPRFLLFSLSTDATQKSMKEASGATAVSALYLRDISKLEISLPTLPEQQEIVRRVEALFAFADRIEARLATAQKTIERLTPATLAKAFRGELVPQDPNDEPASALLERIRQQKTSSK